MSKKHWRALPDRITQAVFPVAKTDIYKLSDGTEYLAVFDDAAILQRWTAFEYRKQGKRGTFDIYRIGKTAEGRRDFANELSRNKVAARRILDIDEKGAITSEPFEVSQ